MLHIIIIIIIEGNQIKKIYCNAHIYFSKPLRLLGDLLLMQ